MCLAIRRAAWLASLRVRLKENSEKPAVFYLFIFYEFLEPDGCSLLLHSQILYSRENLTVQMQSPSIMIRRKPME